MTGRLKISAEWERSDARLPLLRRSWARIVVRVDDTPLTRLIDLETGSYRDGVFGAAWPFASWIVSNWWSLLGEGRRFENTSIRAARVGQKSWFHRHNLMTAQEASALPNVSLYRDGTNLGCSWHSDAIPRPGHGLQFIESGFASLVPAQASEALAKFVDATLAQCAAERENPEYAAVADDWAATRLAATEAEQLIKAERAARLGLDPFDPEELTPRIDAALELLRPHQRVADDLLEIATPLHLESSVNSVLRALHEVMPHGGRGTRLSSAGGHQRGVPYDVGYRAARLLRRRLGLPTGPMPDLGKLPVRQKRLHDSLEGTGVVGLLGWEGEDYVFGLPQRPIRSERFAVARSLFFAQDHGAGFGGRLVTQALSWEQAASRSFAAELLAPAEALRTALPESVDDAEITKLADEFNVAEKVIEHQIVNHHLATMNA